MRNRIISILLSISIIFGFLPIIEAANFTYTKEVDVMYIGNVETGEAYYKKQDDKSLPVASMSKLMTFLIAKDEIEKGNLSLDDIVNVTDEASKYNIPGYSRLELNTGDKISVRELLEGLMVVSGNDASTAIAIHIAGNEKNFVEMMNKKASELGLTNSSFVNSSGVTDETDPQNLKYNKMSAQDLFKLSRHIVTKYPEVEEYGKISVISSPERNYTGNSTLPNRDMPSMTGLKTGFTEEAGYCFTGLFDISLDEQGQDYKLITIVMGADTPEMRATTTSEMVQYVRDTYSLRTELSTDTPVVDITDDTTEQRYIHLYPEKTVRKLLPRTAVVDMKYNIFDDNNAPYEDGEVLGELILSYENNEIEKINLINKGFVPKVGFFNNMFKSLKEVFNNIMLLF